MKKIFVAGMLLAGTIVLTAQTTIYTGSSTVNSNRIVRLAGNYLYFQPSLGGGVFINGTTGLVGINTQSPSEMLDVNGNIKGVRGIFTNALSSPQLFSSYTDRNAKSVVISAGYLNNAPSNARTFGFYDFPASNIAPAEVMLNIEDRNYMSRFRFVGAESSGGYMTLYDKNQITNLTINDDGNNTIQFLMPKPNTYMCIGTTSYSDGSEFYNLSVNGAIRADRVKVYTTWADYVFEEDYKLPTLEEVERHIEEKGHLIDIPSAAEVEEKGIELGEMNKLLLQKIEELTLYTIELNKQVQELKSQMNKQ
ncbi:hypothetical protein [Flavobacterium coralii]|uniref:hypothetical protein n=1 Tax=Flavobacterium coralii TaxID=2838017 RepID=UPI000C5161FD|nr:hypothetical protein [Flavobacterium sp.]|tara:strand:- start:31080 stop:32003 length:924 start_codon:yes stop_codon:yes gene_type:complete